MIRDRLLDANPELICLPESHIEFMPDDWHGAFGAADWGYPIRRGQRKIALWSRKPWSGVDDVGGVGMPPGRFVRAATMTSCGEIDVVGVCIPYMFAHVGTGRRDRAKWEDHQSYLAGLREVLTERASNPSVVIGDFNQTVPRSGAPPNVYESLRTALAGYSIWTEGPEAGATRKPVCHAAGSDHFELDAVTWISRRTGETELSDHDGFIVDLVAR